MPSKRAPTAGGLPHHARPTYVPKLSNAQQRADAPSRCAEEDRTRPPLSAPPSPLPSQGDERSPQLYSRPPAPVKSSGGASAIDASQALDLGGVVRTCRRFGLSFHDAEDAAQDTLVRFFTSRSFRRGADPTAFVHGILRNVCHEVLRRKQRDPLPLLHDVPGVCPEPDRKPPLDQLSYAISMLPDDLRKLAGALLRADSCYAATARELGEPKSTVRTRAHTQLFPTLAHLLNAAVALAEARNPVCGPPIPRTRPDVRQEQSGDIPAGHLYATQEKEHG